MANKITHSWTEDCTGLVFTGSVRQPTLVEIHNYMQEKRLPVEGVFVVCARLGDEWLAPENNRSVTLVEFDDHCPVCGKPYDFSTDECPLCHRGWN